MGRLVNLKKGSAGTPWGYLEGTGARAAVLVRTRLSLRYEPIRKQVCSKRRPATTPDAPLRAKCGICAVPSILSV